MGEIKQTLSSDWLKYPGKKEFVHPVTSRNRSSPKNESGDELHEFTYIFFSHLQT